MFGDVRHEEQETRATERGRSPSGVARVGGPADPPLAPALGAECPPPLTAADYADRPAADLSAPEAAWPPASEDVEAAAPGDGRLIDEEPFPKEPFEEPLHKPRLGGTGSAKGRRLVKPEEAPQPSLTPEQRLLILDTWQRSGLPAGDFATMVGVSKHTLYAWKKKFEQQGPAGLMDHPRGGPKGSRLPDLTKRTILMLKQSNPDWGCQRISDMLVRGPALPASPAAVAKVLHEAGYQLEETPTRPHPDKPRQFERATPNQLWQTDLFTFILKRQNRRVYLVAFMDDHSRFVAGYGLYASQSSALVLEVVRAAIGAYGPPQEILTDNGSQYVTWRGKSAFTRELEKRGIRQIVASPHRPQTLGKIERFWGTLWRECIEAAVFLDMEDARRRIGHFIDYYNFQRPHQGIEGLVPADRFFGAAPDVLQTLRQRVAANALELARNGVPKAPFYVTGRIGDRAFSVHAEGERMILKREGQERREVDLALPSVMEVPLLEGADPEAATPLPMPVCPDGSPQGETIEPASEEVPGASPLDAGLQRLEEAMPSGPPEPSSGEGGSP
jgi:transposase InsO family protein